MSTEGMSNSELVSSYIQTIWNEGDIENAPLYLADTCWRHDTDLHIKDAVKAFSLEDQMKRLKIAEKSRGRLDFQTLLLLESGEYVTQVWNLTASPSSDEIREKMRRNGCYIDDQGQMLTKGVEVFRVVDGKFVEVWITAGPWMPGHWGETKTASMTTTKSMDMSPAEIVDDYVTRMWNKADPSAIDDYLAETCWRHDAGEPERQFMQFDHDFQRQRAQEGYDNGKFDFQNVLLLESGEYVTTVWNLDFKLEKEELIENMKKKGGTFDDDGNLKMKGMEIFHVVDGKIVEVWVAQCWDFMGHWGATMSGP